MFPVQKIILATLLLFCGSTIQAQDPLTYQVPPDDILKLAEYRPLNQITNEP